MPEERSVHGNLLIRLSRGSEWRVSFLKDVNEVEPPLVGQLSIDLQGFTVKHCEGVR